MAHREQRAFFATVRRRFPWAFRRVRVLDCGSLDINGTLKPLFTNSRYVGVDIRPGANVDLVSRVHDVDLPDGSFDTVVSAEMLEHDEYWCRSLQRMYRLLKRGGLLVVSAAGTGRAEHGTETNPDADAIYGTSPMYYRNLTPKDLKVAFGAQLMRRFSFCRVRENGRHADLYFYGVKR